MLPMYNPITRLFLLPGFIPISVSLSIFPLLTPLFSFFFLPDPEPEPQRDLSDQFPSRVQVHSGPYSLPEAGQIPGGYHIHREHGCHQGEWHLLCHLHPALRSGHCWHAQSYKLSTRFFTSYPLHWTRCTLNTSPACHKTVQLQTSRKRVRVLRLEVLGFIFCHESINANRPYLLLLI